MPEAVFGLPLRLAAGVTITPSIDGTWSISPLANLLDNNNATEIQANSVNAIGHWVRLTFSRPVRLYSLFLFARGGGAGAGNCTWTTSSGVSVANGSMAPSTSTLLQFGGTVCTWIQGTFTASRTNFDGWGSTTPTYAPYISPNRTGLGPY